jgi:hypothetical protein
VPSSRSLTSAATSPCCWTATTCGRA